MSKSKLSAYAYIHREPTALGEKLKEVLLFYI